MGYHHLDPDDLEQYDDRDADVRSLTEAAGYPTGDSPLGLRVYELVPGEQTPLTYHYHERQVEAFYVLEGELHVETPEGELTVAADEALVVDPESPQRAFNPADADESVRVLTVGAPSTDDGVPYDPDGG